ncbi:hypothetical protein [Amniculibacterium sp. G2-70]|uniref:hypothetical protein n=1 Tax=Amniculibacterium sp. G2-70 TaxID=2767188 RepID=UPI001654C0D4|nr:hypothetical protein [Amniculibacterium sp. G2-70]
MSEPKINEDFLLLLVDNNGLIETSTITIDNHFENETLTLKGLCQGENDNINQITLFLSTTLKPKLPNKIFNYCKELDKAYQSVIVNIEEGIKDILTKRDLIYTNEKIAVKEEKDFNLGKNIDDLKNQIFERITLWFKVFNIEFAYEKAKKVPNMLVYSHRISGWSNPEYRITDNLKQQVKTNFGYGSVSYFYSLLTFKNIQITPFSEWIDYRYSNFSEVIRYTRSFRSRIAVLDDRDRLRYYKTKIENTYWNNAIEFTKNAANLSLTNEKEFIEKYIIAECEFLVNGLENFYSESEFDFVDENQVNVETDKIIRHRVDIKGYELIDFRTEKIIGALDFITKIIEYSQIVPTNEYIDRLILINKRFIPNVYSALNFQKEELKKAQSDYNVFLIKHNELVEKQKFYQTERIKLKADFDKQYKDEYLEFNESLTKSLEEQKQHNHKIKLHTDNINKLTNYINKYKDFIKE